MSTATYKGYTDGTPSAGIATRYGDDRTFLELPLNQPVEVEKEALAAVKALAEAKGEDGQPIYEIEVDTGAAAKSASAPAGGDAR